MFPSRLDHSADQFPPMDPHLDYPFILDGETDWTINNELQVWSKHSFMSIWNRFHRTAPWSETRTSKNGQSPWTLYSLTRKFTSFCQYFQLRQWYFWWLNFRRFVMQIQMKSCSYWHSFLPFLMVQMTRDRHITYIRNFSSISSDIKWSIIIIKDIFIKIDWWNW